MREIHQRILATLAIVTIIAILGVTAHQYSSLDWLITQEASLRELVQRHSVVSWILGFLIYTCLALIPGTPGKAVICGWLFGFWAAVLMVDGALTVAALVTFLTSRFLFCESVESRFGIRLVQFRQKLKSNQGFYLLTLRLLHVPFSFINYLAGATNIVPIHTFWWTTQLGVLPGTMIFVFVGTRIPDLSTIAERGVFGLLDSSLLTALVSTLLLPVMIKWLAAVISHRLGERNADCSPERSQPLSGATDVRH